jgi:hypothetical protein
MNESLFTHGAFDSARALVRPDFEVMMTLASLRQVNSPTGRLAMARARGEGMSDATWTQTILAGEAGQDARRCDAIASFYDLSHLDASDGWPLFGCEGAVNLGISTNIQSLAVNGADPAINYGSI